MTEISPYQIKMNGEPFWVVNKPSTRMEYLKEHPEMEAERLGFIALGAFRENSYADYIAIAEIDDVEETKSWVRIFEQYEMFDWMAGLVYRDEKRAKQLKDTERSLGRFALEYGWSPDYVLEDRPSDYEMQAFIDSVIAKDEVNGELTFRGEDDDSS